MVSTVRRNCPDHFSLRSLPVRAFPQWAWHQPNVTEARGSQQCKHKKLKFAWFFTFTYGQISFPAALLTHPTRFSNISHSKTYPLKITLGASCMLQHCFSNRNTSIPLGVGRPRIIKRSIQQPSPHWNWNKKINVYTLRFWYISEQLYRATSR